MSTCNRLDLEHYDIDRLCPKTSQDTGWEKQELRTRSSINYLDTHDQRKSPPPMHHKSYFVHFHIQFTAQHSPFCKNA